MLHTSSKPLMHQNWITLIIFKELGQNIGLANYDLSLHKSVRIGLNQRL